MRIFIAYTVAEFFRAAVMTVFQVLRNISVFTVFNI